VKQKESNNKKKKKGKSKIKRAFLIFFVFMLVVVGGIVTAFWLRFNYYGLDREDLAIGDNEFHSRYVRNIAIFGVDPDRRGSFTGLSDTIMMITLDYYNEEIKITSFMRDSIVRIDREGRDSVFTRQNHAYSYGGAQLAIQTMNRNYDLDIQDFMAINFDGFERVINRLGGITIDVQPNELAELNRVIDMTNREVGGTQARRVQRAGEQTLTGRQALAYSRIRRIGGDSGRTDRNRIVMEQIITQLSQLNHAQLVALAYEFMPYVQTSFSIGQIVDTVSDFNTFRNAPISQFRYPVEFANARVRGMSLVRPITLEENVQKLMYFLYGVEDYEVSDTVREISQAIEAL